jgi:hypothetical protein
MRQRKSDTETDYGKIKTIIESEDREQRAEEMDK